MLAVEEVKTKTREETIIEWYQEVFPNATRYIQHNGGNLEEAREVFQDALVLYYEKSLDDQFQPEVGDKAYLMGIVKHQWLKHRRSRPNFEGLEHVEAIEEYPPAPRAQKLLNYLKQAGLKCMDLLQSFYYEQLTMKELAIRFGYSGERSATVQKYKCLEKVRDEIKQKSQRYEDFLD